MVNRKRWRVFYLGLATDEGEVGGGEMFIAREIGVDDNELTSDLLDCLALHVVFLEGLV